MELTDSLKTLLIATAKSLKGSARRLFTRKLYFGKAPNELTSRYARLLLGG
jgi:hypothetical protein